MVGLYENIVLNLLAKGEKGQIIGASATLTSDANKISL